MNCNKNQQCAQVSYYCVCALTYVYSHSAMIANELWPQQCGMICVAHTMHNQSHDL